LEDRAVGMRSCRCEGLGGSGLGVCFDDAYAMNLREWCVFLFYVGVERGWGGGRCLFLGVGDGIYSDV